MKKVILIGMILMSLSTAGCSKEDGPKCHSCTSVNAKKVEICDNGDGTYTLNVDGDKGQLTQEELDEEGYTAKEVVEEACEYEL